MAGKRVEFFFLPVAAILVVALYTFSLPIRMFLHEALHLLSQGDVQALRSYLLSFGVWAPVISFLLMILQSLVAPLPSFAITFANGFLFGTFWGFLLSWGSAMVAAALAFGISRTFGRGLVEKLVNPSTLIWADDFFRRYGNQAVLIARLLPLVSFDLISYAAGLTVMRFGGFWIATGIGQAPAALFYSFLGQRAGQSLKLAFYLLSVLLALGILASLLAPSVKRRLASPRHSDS